MLDWMVSDDANEHIINLVQLRDRLVEERRVQVAATIEGDADCPVSEGGFLKIRELQARIGEVEAMLRQEKGAAHVIILEAESEARAQEAQARHEARWGSRASV